MATAKKTAANDPFDAFASISPAFFKDGYEKFSETMGTFVDFQKASIEALMTSAGAVAKGVEQAATDQTTFAKETFDEGVAAAKAAAGSKSVQEALDVHNDFYRQTFEKNLKQLNKTADHFVSVTKEASQPITDQYGVLVEKVQSFRP